jgi:hypothetical protein
MLRKCKKLKIAMFSFAIIILSLQLSDFAWPESVTNEQFTHTAEIIFNRNQTGLLTATIIPYASDGSYARSGWIDCEIIDADIVRIYSEKLKSRDEFRGYFIATYKKLEENRKSLILRYKGELLRIEPWNPSFIKKDR